MQTELSEICKECGMCCDGTLFGKAPIDDYELKLVQYFDSESITEKEGKFYFKHPCIYFDSCCTVYDKVRPNICTTYFCSPLKKVQQGESELKDAQEIIKKALKYRSEILVIASQIEIYKTFSISQLLKEVLPIINERIKPHHELWLKLIGFQSILAKIIGSK